MKFINISKRLSYGLVLRQPNISKCICYVFPVSILYKSIAGRYRPVRVADGPITARYRFIKNASWVVALAIKYVVCPAGMFCFCDVNIFCMRVSESPD